MLKPHPAGQNIFETGELRKSSYRGGHGRIMSGGASGYKSEARHTPIGKGKYQFKGILLPTRVVKTVISYRVVVPGIPVSIEGEAPIEAGVMVKKLSKQGFISIEDAFTVKPFTFQVEYIYGDREAIGKGESIVVRNVTIK